MKKKIYANARFIPRRRTLAEWEAENPVLLAGEHGFVSDGKGGEREKIGDGITAWNDLEWWKGLSAYEIAVENGFEGTKEEWLASLKGEKGDKGINIYSGTDISIPNSTVSIKSVRTDIPNESFLTRVNVGDIYINTDEQRIYQCLAVSVSGSLRKSTWVGLNYSADQTFDGDSINAQSGIAVKDYVTGLIEVLEENIESEYGQGIEHLRNEKADKTYVDEKIFELADTVGGFDDDVAALYNAVGDFETALDELHNYATEIINGGAE